LWLSWNLIKDLDYRIILISRYIFVLYYKLIIMITLRLHYDYITITNIMIKYYYLSIIFIVIDNFNF
jgi:hypothetical protein